MSQEGSKNSEKLKTTEGRKAVENIFRRMSDKEFIERLAKATPKEPPR